MKIAYFGNDLFYDCFELLVKSGHEVVAIFTRPPTPANEYDFSQHITARGEYLNIPVITTKPTKDNISALECDLLLSAGYPHKIPTWEDTNIKHGINIHPSLLPVGAGRTPCPQVIIKDLKETGLTLHKLSQEWDGGDIILQESFPLSGRENQDYIIQKSRKLALTLLTKFLSNPDEYWNSAMKQQQKDRDYWPHPKQLPFLEHLKKDVEEAEKYVRAHRFVSPNGTVEFMSHVFFKRKAHGLESGLVVSQENDQFVMTAKDGIISFKQNLLPDKRYDCKTGKELQDQNS